MYLQKWSRGWSFSETFIYSIPEYNMLEKRSNFTKWSFPPNPHFLIFLTKSADLTSLKSFLGAHQISSQFLENISELGFFIYSLTKSTSFSICWKFQRTWMWNVVFYNILNFQMCSSKNKVVVVFLKRPTFFGLKYYWSQNLQLVWEFV